VQGRRPSPWSDRRRGAGCIAVVSGGIGAALLLLGLLVPSATPPGAADSAVPVGSAGSAAPDASGPAGPEPKSDPEVGSSPAPVPTHLDIPRIGVHTDVIPLGLNPDGTVMVPPADPQAPAGWYRHFASPGEPGPAVLLGHVDSHRGPAVFHRLSDLVPGDSISVDRADGRTVVFTVRSVQIHPKNAFPTDAVYGQTVAPTLRLVTCGGTFDRVHRTYLSNVVVYAELAS
jgi:sortase (surface protein transpeptidase)